MLSMSQLNNYYNYSLSLVEIQLGINSSQFFQVYALPLATSYSTFPLLTCTILLTEKPAAGTCIPLNWREGEFKKQISTPFNSQLSSDCTNELLN